MMWSHMPDLHRHHLPAPHQSMGKRRVTSEKSFSSKPLPIAIWRRKAPGERIFIPGPMDSSEPIVMPQAPKESRMKIRPKATRMPQPSLERQVQKPLMPELMPQPKAKRLKPPRNEKQRFQKSLSIRPLCVKPIACMSLRESNG